MIIYGIFLFFIIIILLFWMLNEAFRNKVVKHKLQFAAFPPSFGKVRIFFISDIHRRVISDKIISEVKGQVDMVIIGGDLAEQGVSIQRIKVNIKKLTSLGPTYFVWGNNDYEIEYHELVAALVEQDITILKNTAVVFESDDGDKISLLGVDDLTLDRDRLELALKDAEQASFKILASHNPEIMKKVIPNFGISLVLSGHTHGGQIRIFGLGLYERGKIKKINQTILLNSNGYGTTSIPLRLGAPAECHLIMIKSDE